MKFKLFSGVAMAAALAVCAGANAEPQRPIGDGQALFPVIEGQDASGDVNFAGPALGAWGFDATGMDKAAKPGDSFYDFANGVWFQKTAIPGDRTRFGSFDLLADRTTEQVRTLIEADVAAHPKLDTNKGKIAAGWTAFMDEARIEKLDADPIKPDLAKIGAIKSKAEMAAFMGHAQARAGSSFFRAFVGADAKDPDHYALYSGAAGLGLPDRDYYLKPAFADKKLKYRAYVAQMLTMVGWPDAEKRADEIVTMETAIAEASWSRAQSRDRDKTYNPMTPAELAAMAPGFEWSTWFDAMGLGTADRVIITTNTAFPKIAKIYADSSLDTLKAWEAFHVVDQTSPLLSKRFVDAQFDFRSRELSGQKEQRPRWKRGVGGVNGALGEAVGQEYVARYFPPESKVKMDGLVKELRVALRHRIENLTWMSPETKVKALEKLDQFGVKIGYPDKWRDYSALHLDPTDAVGNARRSGEFEWNYRKARLGKVVDHSEWGMTPQTVNAQYSPTSNDITFPAAILQAPFFDPNADMAVNYGGIGGVIGHEMTHGFDDQGRKSDGHGKLSDWWQPQDAEKFKVQAAKYGAQFDTYEVAPGVHVKGEQTMGENIGDLGGLLMALDAYHASLHGKPAPVIDGFTGDQRVFLGWAQVWREKATPDTAKQLAVVDVHSPPRFRIDGPMRNIDAWYDAWGVKEGDKLYLKPEDRVRIW
jgi:putative endopeptidase